MSGYLYVKGLVWMTSISCRFSYLKIGIIAVLTKLKQDKQGSQLASCRTVSCVGFHVVSWIPHGVHVETTWCQHIKPQGVYISNHMVSVWKPWK